MTGKTKRSIRWVKKSKKQKYAGIHLIAEFWNGRVIENPKEIVKVDNGIKAKIVEIKDGRVNSSLKALQPNPWDKVKEKYQASQEINGTITKFNPFGAFVALDPEIQGIIHISEFGGNVEEMKSKLEVGKSYVFKIDSIKSEEKRIILKLKK